MKNPKVSTEGLLRTKYGSRFREFQKIKNECQEIGPVKKGWEINKKLSGGTFIWLYCEICGIDGHWISYSTAKRGGFKRRCLSCACTGIRKSKATREKISLTLQGHSVSLETRRKISEKNKIRWRDPAYREHMSEAHGGNPGYWRGKQLTKEHRQKLSISHLGQIPTLETRKKLSEAHRGSRHWNWKGGRRSDQGYVIIYEPDNPMAGKNGYVREHRKIMADVIGRPLKPEEVVHHIDGNRRNNQPNNLKLFKNHAAHIRYHAVLTLEAKNAEKTQSFTLVAYS